MKVFWREYVKVRVPMTDGPFPVHAGRTSTNPETNWRLRIIDKKAIDYDSESAVDSHH